MRKWLQAIGFYRGFLVTSFTPIFLGALLAWQGGAQVRWGLLIGVQLAVWLTHAAANLLNDHYDHRSGADVDNPVRTPFSGGTWVIQDGLLTPAQIHRAGYLLLSLAAALFAVLSLLAGWWLFGLAAFGLLCAWGYTASPLRLAYRGLGELAIGLTHGPAATLAGYLAAGGGLPWVASLAGTVLGLGTMAIITINQIPDLDADTRAGKRNLVVRFGAAQGLRLWALWLYLSFVVLTVCFVFETLPRGMVLGLLIMPRVIRLIDRAPQALDDLAQLTVLCGETIKTTMLYSLLLAAGVACQHILEG